MNTTIADLIPLHLMYLGNRKLSPGNGNDTGPYKVSIDPAWRRGGQQREKIDGNLDISFLWNANKQHVPISVCGVITVFRYEPFDSFNSVFDRKTTFMFHPCYCRKHYELFSHSRFPPVYWINIGYTRSRMGHFHFSLTCLSWVYFTQKYANDSYVYFN